MSYLDLVAGHLDAANGCVAGTVEEAQHLGLAVRFQRLAMIERGLLPEDSGDHDA